MWDDIEIDIAHKLGIEPTDGNLRHINNILTQGNSSKMVLDSLTSIVESAWDWDTEENGK